MWERNPMRSKRETEKGVVEDQAPTLLGSFCKCCEAPLSIFVCRNPLGNFSRFNHISLNEVQTLNFKFQAQKWIMSGIFPSLFTSSLCLPFPLSASSVRHRQSPKKHFFSFLEENKQKWAVKAGLYVFPDLTHFDWFLLFCPLCFCLSLSLCPQLSLRSAESFLPPPNRYLQTASLEVGRFKHLPQMYVLTVGKTRCLKKFSKIASALWRTEAKERSRFKIIVSLFSWWFSKTFMLTSMPHLSAVSCPLSLTMMSCIFSRTCCTVSTTS